MAQQMLELTRLQQQVLIAGHGSSYDRPYRAPQEYTDI